MLIFFIYYCTSKYVCVIILAVSILSNETTNTSPRPSIYAGVPPDYVSGNWPCLNELIFHAASPLNCNFRVSATDV